MSVSLNLRAQDLCFGANRTHIQRADPLLLYRHSRRRTWENRCLQQLVLAHLSSETFAARQEHDFRNDELPVDTPTNLQQMDLPNNLKMIASKNRTLYLAAHGMYLYVVRWPVPTQTPELSDIDFKSTIWKPLKKLIKLIYPKWKFNGKLAKTWQLEKYPGNSQNAFHKQYTLWRPPEWPLDRPRSTPRAFVLLWYLFLFET